MAEAQWYYSDHGHQRGPVDFATLKRMREIGVIEGTTLVWRDGLADWEPADAHVPGGPPPVPGGPAAPRVQGGRDYHERVGMGEAFGRFWRRYFDFRGRSNRGEYWWAVLALTLLSLAVSIVDAALFGSSGGTQPLSSLLSLATLIPSISLAVRRLHDTDRSGWWIVAPLGLGALGVVFAIPALQQAIGGVEPEIPVGAIACFLAAAVLGIVLLVWYCQRGTSGPNRFG